MSTRALCVGIHDVAQPTWPQCRQLITALRAVGDFPVALLLVPRWHGHRLHHDAGMVAALQALLDDGRGHEVQLHGLYHVDDAGAPAGIRARLIRQLLTRGEGEFSALDMAGAIARMRNGLDDLQALGLRGLQVRGFVPPAWLLSRGARQALVEQGGRLGLRYASLYTGLLDLQQRRFVAAPALVYSVRWRAGDALVRVASGVIAQIIAHAPLLRIGLHPADLQRPANLRHAQGLLERVLRDRVAMTEGRWLENHIGKFRACTHEKA